MDTKVYTLTGKGKEAWLHYLHTAVTSFPSAIPSTIHGDFCIGRFWRFSLPWWRHQIEPFSASLALCAGNSPVTGEFPSQKPMTRSFDVFFDLRLNKQSRRQSLETPPLSLSWLRRHCNAMRLNTIQNVLKRTQMHHVVLKPVFAK